MDRLTSNQILGIDQQLTSANGRVRLVMQGDGNLVLYRTDTGIPLWASNTYESGANRAVMQGDGNFVVYRPDDVPVFDTGTWGNPDGTQVVLQDDGNLVIYRPDGVSVWASNTVVDWSLLTAETGDVRLGVARWMASSATMTPGGAISGRSRYWCNWELRGFTASCSPVLMDAAGRFLWVGEKERHGVDGRLIPFKESDRTVEWHRDAPADLIASGKVARLGLLQYLDGKNRLLEDLGIVGEAVEIVVKTIREAMANGSEPDYDANADSGVVVD